FRRAASRGAALRAGAERPASLVRMPPRVVLTILLGAAAATTAAATPQQSVFKAGVDVVTVTVTVTDENGRFVSGLQKDDFLIYDEGEPQEIVTFSSERVPVSLGVVLDI